jgi:DNA-binding XRE family transcriptional regulator
MAVKRWGLAQRRKAVGLSQEALAGVLDVDRSTVVRWEGGETDPLPWIRPKLAQALHLSVYQLGELLAEGGAARQPSRCGEPDGRKPGLGAPPEDRVLPLVPTGLTLGAAGGPAPPVFQLPPAVAAQFEALLREARAAARGSRWAEAADRAGVALALWRGEPLADAGSDVLAAREAPRLAELRLQAAETRIDADLHLGRHGEVIGELRRLAAAQPLRERLHALLMLALYRDGRQAEALAAYRQARGVLVEELGAEPGPELQQLHQQIIDADPTLTLAGPATPAVAAAPTGPTPRQLPAAVAGFTGRAVELAALTQILDDAAADGPGTVVISAIGGTAGVGKTALALHWAHRVAARFGDGQLHVNLRGFEASSTPVGPEAAIRGFLHALGVPSERIPPAPEAQAGLYRSLLSGRRMLVVLDNARDEQQVRPLLSASPGTLMLVTSRSQLSGLGAIDGARLLTLDVLSHVEAVQMLAARLGTARPPPSPPRSIRSPACARTCRWHWRSPRPAPPPGQGSRWPPWPPNSPIRPAAWTPWMPAIRAPACGRCSPGPTSSSVMNRRGCSGCWASTPAPTSPSPPPPAWPQ